MQILVLSHEHVHEQVHKPLVSVNPKPARRRSFWRMEISSSDDQFANDGNNWCSNAPNKATMAMNFMASYSGGKSEKVPLSYRKDPKKKRRMERKEDNAKIGRQ